jgi:hypothetical protein
LAIGHPAVNQPEDPFIELTTLEAVFGRYDAERIAKKFATWIMQTSPWVNGEIRAKTVDEFLDTHPDGLARLYVQAFPLFDDPEEVAHMKAYGFDGAIHGGAGLNAGGVEYRVFDADSVWEVPSEAISGPTSSLRGYRRNRQ